MYPRPPQPSFLERKHFLLLKETKTGPNHSCDYFRVSFSFGNNIKVLPAFAALFYMVYVLTHSRKHEIQLSADVHPTVKFIFKRFTVA